jgi:site-specific DNA-cytosine methylase
MMNVMSLFAGMEGGLQSFKDLGMHFDKWYSSEVNQYAIKVIKDNHEDAIHLGDVTKWRDWDINWSSIDLVIGGSPCQGFSFAGKGLAFDDPRSALFFEYLSILNHIKAANPSVKFMLENVVMKKECETEITKLLGVEPVRIQSNVVSPVDRDRLYWFNWSCGDFKGEPLSWGDVREWGVDDRYYYSEAAFNWLANHAKRKNKDLRLFTTKGKMQMLEASMFKNYSSQRFFGILDHKGVRYITPTECARCHDFPDSYTEAVSNTRAYEMYGNGWDLRVIKHILKGMANA